MNKAEKIKVEIERRLRTIEPNLPSREEFDKVADRNPGINSDFNIGEKMGAYTMLKKVEQFIDSLEEKPVSNDLEEAAWMYYDKNKPLIPHELDLHKEMISFFIAGAQWQKKHLFDNRIKDCNNITEEQYNLEAEFLDGWIEKYDRLPTFLDAIEYGMKLQKEQDQSTIELAEDHAMLAGMEKMKEEMIDKFFKWLAKHWREYVWMTDNDVIHFGHWEYDFKKAMEE